MSALDRFLADEVSLALVTVAEALGSTPREQGAWMLVSPGRCFGTIGGGQLEFLAIAEARKLLRSEAFHAGLDVPLGPEIGQCCGGRVSVAIELATDAVRLTLAENEAMRLDQLPHVYLFGGGHVGHALASALALLPVRVVVVETRAEALDDFPTHVEKRLTAIPEAIIRNAPFGSAFVILTHDHALDFLLAAQALSREDAAYVGMIGSRTKKATFRSWHRRNGGADAAFNRLVSPIGGMGLRDKRPAVIAALAAAEIATAVLRN